MSSERFKNLPKNTSTLNAELIEKLIPVIKKNCNVKFDESLIFTDRSNKPLSPKSREINSA